VYSTPKSLKVDPGVFQVTEASPTQTNWRRTTAASVQVSAPAGDRTTVRFGNVCVGGGGSQGAGYWTTKNGDALFGADDLALMVSFSLRNRERLGLQPEQLATGGSPFRAYQTALRDALLNANENKSFVSRRSALSTSRRRQVKTEQVHPIASGWACSFSCDG
jgi:hypothetical protein